MEVSCDAESPGKNSTKQYTELTQSIVEARKNTQAQISEYDTAVQVLTNLITQSFGVYKTAEERVDGTVVYYMHERPVMAESKTIWKMTTDTFAVSIDGGETWNAGMDSSGNAVVNVLSAIGINCDWIHAGTLTLGGYNNQNGKIVMQDAKGEPQGYWDNGTFYTTAPITSDNPKDKYSICIDNGVCFIRGQDGNIKGRISYINEGISINSIGTAPARLTMAGDTGDVALVNANEKGRMNLGGGEYAGLHGKTVVLDPGEELRVNGSLGCTGRAEFSDGSYLQFRHGVLIGGQTSEGGTF